MPPQSGIENATHEQVRGTEMEMRVNEEESEVGAPREVGLIQLRVCAWCTELIGTQHSLPNTGQSGRWRFDENSVNHGLCDDCRDSALVRDRNR